MTWRAAAGRTLVALLVAAAGWGLGDVLAEQVGLRGLWPLLPLGAAFLALRGADAVLDSHGS